MAEVRWIKIYTDMISNKKIKRIRTLPEGNNIVLIWVFLLAQAGESNRNGALYLTDTLPFRSEDLAIEFNFEVSVINLALITLERFSMIEVFDEIIYIKNWNEYQNIGGMDKIREQTRLRTAIYRDKQKQLQLGDGNRDATVTSRDETELELDLELEKEKDNKTYPPIVEDTKIILNHWNAKKIITHREMPDVLKSHINARLEKYTIDEITDAIDNYHTIITDKDKYWFHHKFTLTEFVNPKNLVRFLTENNPFETLKKNVVQFNRPDNKGTGQVVPNIDESKARNAEFERLKEEKRQRIARQGEIS